MRPVSRKPIGRWKELKWKDCQILLNLSDLLRVEERQWEECICEDLGPASISFRLSFSLCPVVCLCVCLAAYLFLPGSAGLLARLSMCVSLSGCQFAALTSRHLCLTLQPCPRLLSPPMMSTSTLKPPPTTRSTVVSREPRSSWRSDTVTAWRGWVYQQESGRWFLRGNM